jgi:hypothetical protein
LVIDKEKLGKEKQGSGHIYFFIKAEAKSTAKSTAIKPANQARLFLKSRKKEAKKKGMGSLRVLEELKLCVPLTAELSAINYYANRDKGRIQVSEYVDTGLIQPLWEVFLPVSDHFGFGSGPHDAQILYVININGRGRTGIKVRAYDVTRQELVSYAHFSDVSGNWPQAFAFKKPWAAFVFIDVLTLFREGESTPVWTRRLLRPGRLRFTRDGMHIAVGTFPFRPALPLDTVDLFWVSDGAPHGQPMRGITHLKAMLQLEDDSWLVLDKHGAIWLGDRQVWLEEGLRTIHNVPGRGLYVRGIRGPYFLSLPDETYMACMSLHRVVWMAVVVRASASASALAQQLRTTNCVLDKLQALWLSSTSLFRRK